MKAFFQKLKKRAPDSAALVWVGVLFLLSTVGLLNGGLWAAVVLGGIVVSAALLWREQGKFPFPDQKKAVFLLFFLGIATFLSVLSPFPDRSLYTTAKMASVMLPLLLFSSPRVISSLSKLTPLFDSLGRILAVGFGLLAFALGAGILLYGFNSAEMTKLNRGLSYGLLLAGPFLAFSAQQGKKPDFFLIGGLFLALLLTHSRASQIGAFAALAVYVMASFRPRLTCGLLACGFGFSFAWPLLASSLFLEGKGLVYALPDSFAHRIEIWDYLFYRILQKPVTGWGLGASGLLDYASPHGQLYVYATSVAAHPHNAFVQLFVEMGFSGLFFAGASCLWLLKAARDLPSAVRPHALAALAFGLVLLSTAYNFWTDSLWAVMALTTSLFAAFSPAKIKVSLSSKLQDKGASQESKRG